MLQLTNHSIIQFVSLILYAILVPVIMCYGRTGLKRLFLVFLLTSFGCTLASLLTTMPQFSEQAAIIKALVPLFYTWSVVAYAHFAAAFVQRDTRTIAKIGYAWLAFILTLIVFDYYSLGTSLLTSQIVDRFARVILNSIFLANLPIMAIASFPLIVRLDSSDDPEERNRVAYLLAGLCFAFVISIVWSFLPDKSFQFYHIGPALNTVLITYVLLRYRLLDIRLVMKKGLVYTFLTLGITLAYLGLLLVLSNLLKPLSPRLGIPATAVMVILLAVSFNWLRSALDKSVDRLFYGNRYVHRQMLLSFAGQMSQLTDIKNIAGAVLPALAKSIHARHAVLLLASDDYYIGTFMFRRTKEEVTVQVRLHKSSPLIRCLEREGKPLLREGMESNPALTGISEGDKADIDAAKIALFCPILSKNKLIGILASGKKHPRGYYSRDDLDLVAMLCAEAAVPIENAQMYARVKEQANTDELTGLYNHRHFHERLDEEIARCARFGNIFSLLFLDIDLFKNYNDIRGHLAGDEVLQEIGLYARDTIRKVDIGFRYGGDEFAIIMPQTPLNSANDIAEALRRRIAARVDAQGTPVSCSIGVASWPTDGLLKGELIQAADAALYRAKQSGKNRICSASEVALSEFWSSSGQSKFEDKIILNTVYALAATVDAKDHYTYGHSKKVSKYAGDIAEALGCPSEMTETIRTAGLLHDIGKIGVSDHLLSKQGPLSPEDWALIKAHPNMGVSILKHVDSLKKCLAAVQYHHERYDGTGYPSGLKSDKIPVEARILAVADAYDAMTSRRPYRDKEITVEGALAELKRCSGKQFDPIVVNAMVQLNDEAAPKAKGTGAPVTAGVRN